MRQRPLPRAAGDGERVQARSVVIATGARYRRLAVDRLEEFEGSSRPLLGLAAGSRPLRRPGSRAGWRWQFGGPGDGVPGSRARRVTLIARRPLERDDVAISDRADRGAAQYRRGYRLRNLSARRRRRRARGRCWRDRTSGHGDAAAGPLPVLLHRRRAEHRLARRLGPQARRSRLRPDWRRSRGTASCSKTSRRGVFAVGDVRACSVKRVAASVGDGAQVVAAIHAYLAKAREAEQPLIIQQVVATV